MNKPLTSSDVYNGAPKIGLMFGGDFSFSLPMANSLVEKLVNSGVRPVLFYPKHKPLDPFAPQELRDYAFFDRILLQRYVYPFLNLPTKERPDGTNGSARIMGHAVLFTPQQLAAQHDLEIYQVDDVNAQGFIDELKAIPNLKQISNTRGMQIYSQHFLDEMRRAGIYVSNLHPGKLPEYKGVMPVMRALYAAFKAAADPEQAARIMNVATLHQIDRGIDTGDIIGTGAVPLAHDLSVFENYRLLVKKAADLVGNQLVQKLSFDLPTRQQEKDSGSYYTYPTVQELAEYRDIGLRILPPLQKIIDIYAAEFTAPGSPADRAIRELIAKAAQEWGMGLNDNVPDQPQKSAGVKQASLTA